MVEVKKTASCAEAIIRTRMDQLGITALKRENGSENLELAKYCLQSSGWNVAEGMPLVCDAIDAIIKATNLETVAGEEHGEEIYHERHKKVLALLRMGNHMLLHGPAGSGKTNIALQLAKNLGIPYYSAVCITDEIQIEGFCDAHGVYHKSNFRRAVEEGGLFLLDEMNVGKESLIKRINTALANGFYPFPDGDVKVHKNFRCVGTANFGAGYVSGGIELSTLDRFMPMFLDYSPAIERHIANGNEELLEFVYDLRNSLKSCGLNNPVSYRAISGVMKIEREDVDHVLDVYDIMETCFVKLMSADDHMLVASNLTTSNKYSKAFKRFQVA